VVSRLTATGIPERRGIPVRGSTSSVVEVRRLTPGVDQPWGRETTPGRIDSVTARAASVEP
jgi:hypothetical protein